MELVAPGNAGRQGAAVGRRSSALERAGEERLDQEGRSNRWVGMPARNLGRSRDSPLLLSLVPRRGDAGGEADLGAAGVSPRRLVILRGLLAAEASLFSLRRVVGRGGVAATTPAGERISAAAARTLSRCSLGSASGSRDARQRRDNGCRCHRDRKQNQKSDAHLFFMVRQDQATALIPFSAAWAPWLEAPERSGPEGPASGRSAAFVRG